MNIIFEYIKYRLNARYLHGVHSPFVYNFMKDGMNIKLEKSNEKEIDKCVFLAKSNHNEITVKDYGAKSKKLKNNRTVNQIFRTSSSFGKNALLLYRLTRYFKPTHVLELGTSIGIGTLHLYMGQPNAKIVSIEGCPETFEIAKQNLQNKSVELVNQTFYDYIKNLNEEKFDLIFIDGHHDGEALKYYIRLLDKHIHDDTIIILDDIRWSKSMLNSWNHLKAEEQYHLSMDFFKMGILMRRPQQEKEKFCFKP